MFVGVEGGEETGVRGSSTRAEALGTSSVSLVLPRKRMPSRCEGPRLSHQVLGHGEERHIPTNDIDARQTAGLSRVARRPVERTGEDMEGI